MAPDHRDTHMVIPAGSRNLCERSPTSLSECCFLGPWVCKTPMVSGTLELPWPPLAFPRRDYDASLSAQCFRRPCIPVSFGRPVCLKTASSSPPVLMQITSGKLMTENLLVLITLAPSVTYFGLIFDILNKFLYTVWGMDKSSSFCLWISNCFIILIENTILSTELPFDFCWKSVAVVLVSFFVLSILHPSSFVYLRPIPHCHS